MPDQGWFFGNPQSAFGLDPSTPLAQMIAQLGLGGQQPSAAMPPGMYSGPPPSIALSIDPSLWPVRVADPARLETAAQFALSFNPSILGGGPQFGVRGVPVPSGISGHVALNARDDIDTLLAMMHHNPDNMMIPLFKAQIEDSIASGKGSGIATIGDYYNKYIRHASPSDVTLLNR